MELSRDAAQAPDRGERLAEAQSTPPWMKRVAMMTGVLAGLVGFLTVRGNNLSIQANLNSTQAVLHRATASDCWSEYQADSVKKNNAESLAKIAPNDDARASLLRDAKAFEARQAPIAKKATDEEALEKQEMQNSDEKLAVRGLIDYAGMAAQVGIALASIAALTRRQFAYWVGMIAGLIAMGITGYAMVHPYLHR